MAEEEHGQSRWIKRLKWSASGLPFLDERINTLASLWAEDALDFREIGPEVRDAVSMSKVRPAALSPLDPFPIYAANIRVAAQWTALLEVMDFAAQHRLHSIEERLSALRLFEQDLQPEATPTGKSHHAWIAAACESSFRGTEAGRPMPALIQRWIEKNDFRDHSELVEECVQIQQSWRNARRQSSEVPEQAVRHWLNAVRAGVTAIALREADVHCRAAGLTTPEQRSEVWHGILDALQKSSPQRSL